ncbi:hypothetical protein [Nocardiopsis sp. NPDC055824]
MDPLACLLGCGAGQAAADIWTGASIDVGEVYTSLAGDITNGTHHTPGFQHAAHNSRLTARVGQAARTGVRQLGHRTSRHRALLP